MSVLQKKRNDCLSLVRASNRKLNCLRFSRNETTAHYTAKLNECIKLQAQNKSYVTEAIFANGSGRADILVLDDFEVIEIASTESEESLIKKSKKYPKGLKIRVVRT